MIRDGYLPPVDAVRLEEFVNYFDYNYSMGSTDSPFGINTEVSDCPWNKENKLLHIGIKGYTVDINELPPTNLVFLVEVSGSMSDANKLPLLKKSLMTMVSD